MPWLWVGIFVVSIILEAVTFDLVSIWAAIAALVVLFISFTSVSPLIQVIIFFVLAFLLFVFTRPLVKRRVHIDVTPTNAQAVIGKNAIVTKTIEPFKMGEVKVDGSFWSAISHQEDEIIFQGDIVKVLEIKGVKLVVIKID